jgi:6-phosphofructokinase 2
VAVSGETRENFTVAESTTGREFRFVLPGPTLHEAEWQACLDRIERLPVRADYLIASGSLPPGVPQDFYARLARWARRSGSRLVLDTSGAPLAAALAEGVWGIKPSLRELRDLTGERLETLPEQAAAARALVVRGQAEMVALSLGPQGALLANARQTLSAAALKVQPVGTVGAGDSFLAGWIAEWATHEDPVRALQMAMAAASAALLAPGTALSDPQQIARLLPQVEVRECA